MAGAEPEHTAAEAVRAEVRPWLAATWDPDRPLAAWRADLVDSGWGCPAWPREWYGRGLPDELAKVVAEEFRSAGAVPSLDVSFMMADRLLVDGTVRRRSGCAG